MNNKFYTIALVWMLAFAFISGGYVTILLINSDPYVEYVSFGPTVWMQYPENCSENSTSPSVFIPYYFYTDIPLDVIFCGLTVGDEYTVEFRLYENEKFETREFVAFNPAYSFYFRPSITFFHEDLLIVDLYDSSGLLIASAITTYVDLE